MKTDAHIRSNLQPCVGLVIPALLWAVNTEFGLVSPYFECGARLKLGAVASFAAVVVSIGAGALSWRAARNGANGQLAHPASIDFVGRLGGLTAAIFAFGIALQGLSSMMLTGCER
jgi:hypothetical protein